MNTFIFGNSYEDWNSEKESSNHVSEKHIILKSKLKLDRKSLKLSKFFFMLLIFKCNTERAEVFTFKSLIFSCEI